MADNVLGVLFGDIADAIRSKTGDTATMKPAEFPEKIEAIESGTGEGVDPYYQRLAEALMLRDASKLDGDSTKMTLKGFKQSNGSLLGSLAGYSFAGFSKVEAFIFSDVVLAQENAFSGDTSLKIIDITSNSSMPVVSFGPNALAGCTALESIIARAPGFALQGVSISNTGCGNDTFYIYVPASDYDTVTSGLDETLQVPASRYRKLEDFPEVDHWNDTYTVEFYDEGVLVDTQVVKWGQTATPNYSKPGYKVTWEPSNIGITQDTKCYASWEENITFAESPWEKIAQVSSEGNASNYFKVGDTRSIVCNGNSYTAQIVGFNVDTLADGSGTAGISCLITGTYGTTRAYHSSSKKITWAGCSLRTYCNDTIYNGLDSDLKSIIKQVKKKSYNTSSYGAISTNDYCWVPATAEMGKTVYGGIASTYPAITSGAAQRAIGKEYWCRDDNDSAYYAYYIDASGNAKSGSVTGARAIRFGFCI